MKLIKTTNTRTSQACDRCRIKKIKCDGALPSCSNCLKIGYDCKISDKLTRRAFPRGYTENLEKNMISLQNEIVKLNDELNRYKETNVNPDLSVNFFKFSNYLINDQYVGLNSIQSIFNKLLVEHGLPVDIKESKDDDVSVVGDTFLLDKFINSFPSKHNLDLIIQQHFSKLNKLIPIINETTFFDLYKDGMNSHNHDFIIQIILIIQLNCSIFSIHDIHKLITNQFNVISNPSLIKFENLLLSLWLFHNKNCYSSTVISISNLLKSMVLNLGLHLNYNNLITTTTETKEVKFKSYSHRLNLYWCFHILNRCTSILYGLPDSLFFDSFQIPKLSTLVNFNDDLKYPLKLIELLDYDWNLLSPNNEEFLSKWFSSIEAVTDDIVKLQLKLFGLSFKILLNVDSVENSHRFAEIMLNLANSKETGLNNFEFHLIPLNFVKIIIISLFNLLNKELTPEISHLIKESVYESIKRRYPENFILFKDILQYVIDKSTLKPREEAQINSINALENPETSYQSLFSTSGKNSNHSTPSITSSQPANSQSQSASKIRNHSIVSTSSIESILTNPVATTASNYKSSSTMLSSVNNSSVLLKSELLGGDNMINLLNDDESGVTGAKGLLFDWTTQGANGGSRDNVREGFNLVI